MSKQRPDQETPWQRLSRVVVPGTTGGVYTLIPGVISFLVVVALFIHSHFTGRPMPTVTGELLTASVGLMGLHTLRGASADRVHAATGSSPVVVGSRDPVLSTALPPSPGVQQECPDLRPFERL